MHKFYFLVPLGNVVGIAVGVSVAGFILLVILPIAICGGCYVKRRISRHSPTTVTTTTKPVPPTVTVNTTNTHGQQGGFGQWQSHPVSGTGINQAPPQAFEMSAYPPTLQAAYPPPAHASYVPTYPPQQA